MMGRLGRGPVQTPKFLNLIEALKPDSLCVTIKILIIFFVNKNYLYDDDDTWRSSLSNALQN